MALGGRGYMLIDKIGSADEKTFLVREVKRPDNSVIVRTYCAFWKKSKTNYYIEEFAETLGIAFLITSYFCGDKPIYAALNAARGTASTTSGVCLA